MARGGGEGGRGNSLGIFMNIGRKYSTKCHTQYMHIPTYKEEMKLFIYITFILKRHSAQYADDIGTHSVHKNINLRFGK